MEGRMLNTTIKTLIYVALILIWAPSVPADVMPSDWRQKLSDQAWEENSRHAAFQDREIIEDAEQSVLEIRVPYAAEDATLAPVTVHTKIPQTDELYIQRIHVFIDKNPVPLVGIFDFTPASGKADLAMRVRINDPYLCPRRRRTEYRRAVHGQEFHPGKGRMFRAAAQEHR